MTAIADPDVAAVFQGYPPKVRRRALALRKLIFRTAQKTDGVGPLEETLKWGEPAYLTSETGSGTTVRVAWKRSDPDHCGLYFHCQTPLVETFRSMFGERLRFEGNRAILFHVDEPVPEKEVAQCLALALTYHRIKDDLRA